MPFTALKLVMNTFKPSSAMAGCAPPNAVYGIETPSAAYLFIMEACRCAPPNAVYGIETMISKTIFSHLWSGAVVRRLMPFTALKPTAFRNLAWADSRCAPPNAVYGIETAHLWQ